MKVEGAHAFRKKNEKLLPGSQPPAGVKGVELSCKMP